MNTFANHGGSLAGLTILRFAHAFESGGGTERYLDDLDRTLLARNAMTIVRLYLTRSQSSTQIEETMGRGRLIRIPLPVLPGTSIYENEQERSLPVLLKQKVRDWIIYNPIVWPTVGARWTSSRRLPPEPGQAVGAGNATSEALQAHCVNLVILHFSGGSDADEVMSEARRFNVPFAVLNHYSNNRFLHLPIRKHAMFADGLAGVNGLELPRYVRGRFTNLSDGIDTEFFCRANARPLESPPAEPVILLPARVVREKGQLDLVRAAALLHKSGVKCCLVFAGRIDSSGYVDELRAEIARLGMSDHVRFLGNLDMAGLRDWYAASAIVTLPTYHHEGLPRVILEAQAMSVPVIAYAIGGVPDGITNGHSGYLLKTGDVSGLANHLRELLASPSTRSAMGTCGRVAAETRFSLAALAERHEQFYAKIIATSTAVKVPVG